MSAIASLHERRTTYHLAHGLLDYAEYLARDGDAGGADAAQPIIEACDTRRLRCPPLLDRADAIEAALAQVRA